MNQCFLSDEVRLHSRFLFSMLNPAGQHFRNSAFGEAFMLALGYPDWLDWSKVRVFREYNYVDIYLTDGKRHVLVENKLNANDQHGQVRRYIDWVRAVNDEREMPTESDDILFVYLSNGRAAPTRTSLHPYKICASPSGLYVTCPHQ
ncbi:PD-(D/E)XK nuclease family protein [Burkholderia vietnamiensis]|uniref:PD-(D/E)XK nuclease family protein n=1 Tax=Burkholderia vietnamiensis TaxID=60552 RepID=UPI00312CA7BF